MTTPSLSRRDFLQLSAGSLGALGAASPEAAQPEEKSVAILLDPSFASSPPVSLAVQELGQALAGRGLALRQAHSIEGAAPFFIVAAGPNLPLAAAALRSAAVQLPARPESLALVTTELNGKPGVLATANDSRSLMYALRELADRVRHAPDPMQALQPLKPLVEEPFTEVRSVGRLFVSDVEDRPWFENRDFWPPYLSMLAAQRFNRLHLALGIGYDSLVGVTDSYLLFAYPFLLSTPGLPVRLSPKYWAEHVGLPYQQAAIRELPVTPCAQYSSPTMYGSAIWSCCSSSAARPSRTAWIFSWESGRMGINGPTVHTPPTRSKA